MASLSLDTYQPRLRQEGRLVYRGYEIGELAGKATFEEVCHLLWKGALPTRAELNEQRDDERAASVARWRRGPAAALEERQPDGRAAHRSLARGGAARNQGRANDGSGDRADARFPTIVAAFHRLRKGLEPIAPREDLGHAANYLYMLTGEVPPENHVHSLDTYLVLLADHGMNASTFTARVIASTESDLGSAVVGAIGALKGPLHGGAPALVMDMLEAIGAAETPPVD